MDKLKENSVEQLQNATAQHYREEYMLWSQSALYVTHLNTENCSYE